MFPGISKSFLGNTLSLFAIRLTIVASGLIAMIWLARVLPRAEYTAYQFLIISNSVLTAIGSLGIGSVIFNYSEQGFKAFFKELRLRTKAVYLTLLLLLCGCGAYLVVFSGHLSSHASYLSLTLLFALSTLAFAAEQVLLIGSRKKLLLAVNLLFAILWLGAHAFCMEASSFNLQLFIQLWLVLLALKFLSSSLIFSFQKSTHSFLEGPELRASKRSWWQLGFYEVFQLVVRQLDKLMIPYLSSASAAAAYYNGRIEIPLLPALLSSVRSAALMRLGRSGQESETLSSIVLQAFRTLSSVGIPLVVFGVTFSEDLISVIFTNAYADAVPIFICTLLILPAQYCISLSYILQYKDRADIINRGAIGDFVLTLILIYPMYQFLGSLGLVLAVLVSTYAQSFYYLAQASKAVRLAIWRLVPLADYALKIIVALILSQTISIVSNFLKWTNHTQLMVAVALGACTALWFLSREMKYNKSTEAKD